MNKTTQGQKQQETRRQRRVLGLCLFMKCDLLPEKGRPLCLLHTKKVSQQKKLVYKKRAQRNVCLCGNTLNGKIIFCPVCREPINRQRKRGLYHLTEEELQELENDAKGRCMICQEETSRLQIDHDHETGKVRGLLCVSCNLSLGHVTKMFVYKEQINKYLGLSGE